MEKVCPSRLRVGLDVLFDSHRDWLPRQRVALLSHQATLDHRGASSAERLRAELGSGLVALFGPEHGFLGAAGAGVSTRSRRHPTWGIPVHSLYGAHRKPTPAMLRGIDVLVCDLQDLGARCYTYLATLLNVLEAAAAAGVRVIVADRPIPLPVIVDGPVTAPAFASFVAPLPLPMCTGLTPGEAARWICRTRGLSLDLRVAAMRDWPRQGERGAGWPDWVPPSPGIRTWECGMTYLATVFSEALPAIDCGRGTNLAFRLLGAPWLRAEPVVERLQACRLPGVSFHPHRYVAGLAPHAGRELDGVRLAVTASERFQPVRTAVTVLAVLQQLYGRRRVWQHAGARPEWFDRLFGTDRVRLELLAGVPAGEITAAWSAGLCAYRTSRAEALLYGLPRARTAKVTA